MNIIVETVCTIYLWKAKLYSLKDLDILFFGDLLTFILSLNELRESTLPLTIKRARQLNPDFFQRKDQLSARHLVKGQKKLIPVDNIMTTNWMVKFVRTRCRVQIQRVTWPVNLSIWHSIPASLVFIRDVFLFPSREPSAYLLFYDIKKYIKGSE